MGDPRLLSVDLDERSILWRNADIEQERRVAIVDLLEGNHFAAVRSAKRGHHGPYRLTLRIVESRLALDIADEERAPLESVMLALGRFRRPIRDYFAICDSYFRAVAESTAAQIETVDMARRATHDDGAKLLAECLHGKIELDHATARRLFTLICVLHIRG